MSEQFGGDAAPRENEKKLPEGYEMHSVGDMVRQLKNSPDLQEKAFGKTLTDEEFTIRFPENQIATQDLLILASALGYEFASAEHLEDLIKEGKLVLNEETAGEAFERLLRPKKQ